MTMPPKDIVIAILLISSGLLAFVAALGALVMKETYQRLHFSAVVVGMSAPFVSLAVWMQTTDWQARLKVLVISVILFFMNAALTHATARAHRIRTRGHLGIEPSDLEIQIEDEK
jgi:multisubunit Na+/H+ antiporter MnhG subunit